MVRPRAKTSAKSTRTNEETRRSAGEGRAKDAQLGEFDLSAKRFNHVACDGVDKREDDQTSMGAMGREGRRGIGGLGLRKVTR